jgi:sugar lactone lactonase YvrE
LAEASLLSKDEEELTEIYFYLSLSYYSNNQNEKAEEILRKLFKIKPNLRIVDESLYPEGFVKTFYTTRDGMLGKAEEKSEVKEVEKPEVKEKVEKPKKSYTALYILAGLAVAGGVAYLLLAKSKKEEKKGSIDVRSTPEGARVFLDGSDTGKVTNTRLDNVSPGTHSVTLKLQGYSDYTTNVTVSAGQTASVSYNFLTVFVWVTAFTDITGIVDLTVDSNGYLYVVRFSDGPVIQKFTSNGGLVGSWRFEGGNALNQAGEFEGIAVDKSGYVYVTDAPGCYGHPPHCTEIYNYRVQKFNPSMNAIAAWGGKGSGDGQFELPRAIAVDNSFNVYVSDIRLHRIQKFNFYGAFIGKWGSFGSGASQFNNPTGIAVDNSGYVYVVDESNHRIQKFTSDGTFVKMWGSNGSEDGKFNYPYDVAVDNMGYVYVTDLGNRKIQKFTSNGEFVAKFAEGYVRPETIAVDPTGFYLYVGDTLNRRVHKIRIK